MASRIPVLVPSGWVALPAGVVSAALRVVGMARWVRVEVVAWKKRRARILAASMGEPPPKEMRVSIVGS